MSNIHILGNSWGFNASGTSSNEQSDAPFSNLLDLKPSQRWISSSLVTVRGTLNTGESKPWDSCALLYANASDAATWRVTSDDISDNLFTTPEFDTGQVNFRMSEALDSWNYWHSIIYTGSTQTHQFVGIEVTDPSNPDGFFTAGVVVVGEVYTPYIGYDVGSSWGWEDRSVRVELRNSETVYRRQPRKRVGRFTLPWQSDTEAHVWDGYARMWGNSTPLLVKTEPFSNLWHQDDMCWGYCTFDQSDTQSHVPPAYRRASFTISEV